MNLFKPTHKRLVERELDESNRLLLQAQTNMEHWEAQVSYHQKKIQRLKNTWNALSTEGNEREVKPMDERILT